MLEDLKLHCAIYHESTIYNLYICRCRLWLDIGTCCFKFHISWSKDAGSGRLASEEASDSISEKMWKTDSIRWRGELEISPNYSPWTQSRLFKGEGICEGKGRKRILDLIDLTAIQIAKRAKKDTLCPRTELAKCLQDTILDVSQSHKRPTYSNREGVARCLCAGSDLYRYSQDRMLRPVEHLILQGHPSTIDVPPNFTARQIKRMAGESIALPCLGLLIWALYTSVGFPAARRL